MKRLLLLAALLSAPVVAATAQAPAAPVQGAPRHTDHASPHKAAARIGRELNLSADQQARLEPILAERRQKAAAVWANTQLSAAERHQHLKVIHRETRAEMSSVLTPEQMRQMKAIHHARHAATTPTTGV